MDRSLEEIREQQKQNWNKFSGGWKKWDELTMNLLQPMGTAIIGALQLRDTDTVLDIATGTGEPGLTIASMVKKGSVTGTDLSEDMLAIAREHANKKGITNYSTRACDVCELPFDDDSFDAISCRMGFMFFPDMLMAAREMVRVLKPGGKIAVSVWAGPDENPWVTAIMGPVNKNMQVPAPPPAAPGMFRCAEPGFIAELFKRVGLTAVTEQNIRGKTNYGTNEFYWVYMNEVSAPIVAAMAKAGDELKEKIKNEVFEDLDKNHPGANLSYGSIIISGRK